MSSLGYLQHALLTAPATVIDRGAVVRKLLDELGGKDHRVRRCVSASLCRALRLLERDGYVIREGRFYWLTEKAVNLLRQPK